ncbi:hypothetical protein [Celeribacter sp.]|uniref:hypothetical protein n=1 Tax=Celeribacter sp. TaxID=1890673 RepID=UPI003A8F76DF
MMGLGSSFTALALGYAQRLRRENAGAVAAWGDSLTAGAGASAPPANYPAMAAASHTPPRDVANLGVGGQSSTQVAARQGGVPITVTVEDNEIPARFGAEWDFTAGLGRWKSRKAANPPATIYADTATGKLVIEAIGTSQSGAQVWLDETFQSGRRLTVTFELDLGGAPWIEVGLTDSYAEEAATGGWAAVQPVSSSGTHSVTLEVGSANASIATSLLFMAHVRVGTIRISNVTVSEEPALAVLSKSTNILYDSGLYTGSAAGTLAGVHGVMETDAAGNWTFTRSLAGPAVAAPAGTTFIPDSAVTYADRTAWIWVGRNNFSQTAQVQSDIAAMVNHLDHDRVRIGAILTSAADSASAVSNIEGLNADLATTYGAKFVDLLGALKAAGNGSPEDNADIANGYVPRSLRSDDVHLNDSGYEIVASAFSSS